MPQKLIKRFLPSREKIRAQKSLRIFNRWLDHANFWSLNRRSVSGAFAIGLFMAFVPMPFQMVPAAGLAILFKVNLPLSMALVWLTNPLTMPPIFYCTYRFGAWIMQRPLLKGKMEFSWAWMMQNVENALLPFYLGSLLCGVIFAVCGYCGIRIYWRYKVKQQWNTRRQTSQSRCQKITGPDDDHLRGGS